MKSSAESFPRWSGAVRRNPAATALLTSGAAFALYLLISVVVFRHTIFNMDHVLFGPPEDNLQDLWNSWYAVNHVTGISSFIRTNLLRYPEGTELFYHSFAYPKIILLALAGPGLIHTIGALLSLQNILLIISFPLASLGAFLLVRHYTRENFSAFVAGAIFGFNPSHVQQALHHMHVETIEFLPFFALCFILAMERKSMLVLSASVLFYVLSALSSWYYLFYAAYFMVFYVVFQAIADRRWPALWECGSIIVHGAVLAVIASPLLVPMVVAAASGSSVTNPGTFWFGADLLEYVSFPKQHLLGNFTARVRAHMLGNDWEGATYLGLANLLLLAWYFARDWTGRWRMRLFILSGMAVFAVFASGSWLLILGHRLIPMPDWLLAKLPFFSNVRTPSRAIVFVHLFMAIGIGLALVAAWRARPGGWRGVALATGVLAVMTLDWYPARLESTPFSCSAGYRVISADQSPEFGVLDLPIDQYVDWNWAMALQTCHGRPIVSGVVSRELTPTLRDHLIVNDIPAQRKQLEQARVKYIVIHQPRDGQLEWLDEKNGSQNAYLEAYHVLYKGPAMTVLQVYP